MFSSFRNRFGIPGAISVIALVFAMLGGAYAASDNSGSGKATASAKAKRGPRGPKGPAGPAGPQGPAGPAGAKGDKGDAGAAGSNGAAGVTGKTGATGATGKTGATGATGFSGFTKTLPKGETETGTWGLSTSEEKSTAKTVPISFPIPLAKPGNAFYFGKEKTEKKEFGSSGCTGTVAEPTAPEGALCVYTSEEEGAYLTEPFFSFAETFGEFLAPGTAMSFFAEEEGEPAIFVRTGSWAVTAS